MADHNELLLKAEDLADMILQAPEVSAYKDAEQKLQKDSRAQSLMSQLKDLQEQIGDYQARNVPEQYYRPVVEESESVLEQLESIPEVQTFQERQTALNQLLNDISDRLARAVLERIAPHMVEESPE